MARAEPCKVRAYSREFKLTAAAEPQIHQADLTRAWQWASTVAGSGTIEGWLILRPEFTAPRIVWGAMGEGLVQGIALAAWLGRWMMSVPTGATAAGAAQVGGGATRR